VGRRLSPAGRRRLRTAGAPAASLVLFFLALTGCSAGRAPAASDAGAPPGPPAGARTTTAAEQSLLYEAEQELQRRCMTAAGFRFWITSEHPLPEARDFPYVVDDLGWARRYGYGGVLQPRIERLRREDPNRVYLRGLPEERRRAAVAALNGTRDGKGLRAELPGGVVMGHSSRGCQVTAWRELYEDVRGWYTASTLVNNFGGLRRQRVAAEPEYGAAMRSWSACMREHGFPYRDPLEARAAFLSRQGTAHAVERAREVRTAVQEARCAQDTGLNAVVRRLDRHHDRLLRREHRAAVERVETLRAAALPRARAVLAR
jgi:hypothetical protein